jgi:sigma-E factor negative regulatory protein RseC
MIEEIAKVTAIHDHNITVESLVKSSCSGCKQIDNCGSGQIAKAFPQKTILMQLTSTFPVKLGDNVVIGLSEAILLKSAWQVYIWPLIGLIFGALVGQLLMNYGAVNHEILAIVLGIIGGYLGFYCARLKQNNIANCPQWSPVILRLASSSVPITEIHH